MCDVNQLIMKSNLNEHLLSTKNASSQNLLDLLDRKLFVII